MIGNFTSNSTFGTSHGDAALVLEKLGVGDSGAFEMKKVVKFSGELSSSQQNFLAGQQNASNA